MTKKIFPLVLMFFILFPAALFAQLTVSGVTGDNGFVAVRGALNYKVNEDLTVIPMYSYYKNTDDSPSVNRFGLRAEYQPGRIAWGAEAGFVPRKDGYMNYMFGGDAKYFFVGRTHETVEMFYAGLGAQFTRHDQRPGFGFPDYSLGETRANLLAGITVKPVTAQSVFSKGFFSDTPPPVGNIWINAPFFVTINNSFLDYFWNTSASIPLDLLTLHAAYSLAKDYWAQQPYQSAAVGATVKIMGVSVTGNVEFRGFDSNSSRTYFSLSGNLYY